MNWKFPSSSTEKTCFGLAVKVYGCTMWLFEDFRHIKATHSLSKALQACLSVMFWLSSSSSSSSPQPSPHLTSPPWVCYIIFIFLSFHQVHHNLMLSRSAVTLPNRRYWNMPKSTSTVPVDSVLHFFILLNLTWTSQSLHQMFLLWHVFHSVVRYLESSAKGWQKRFTYLHCVSEEIELMMTEMFLCCFYVMSRHCCLSFS